MNDTSNEESVYLNEFDPIVGVCRFVLYEALLLIALSRLVLYEIDTRPFFLTNLELTSGVGKIEKLRERETWTRGWMQDA